MSQKEEKPQLAGVRLKTRKRNIVVPHDPQSFADAVIDIISDAKEEGFGVEQTLDAANKVLGSAGAELDFSRYGDVLFEVAFAGARLTTGGNVATEGKRLEFFILGCPAERASILPFVEWFQDVIRRRPFLVKALESTLIKLILSLEFYDEEGRRKVAIALARVFSLKVGVLPERVLPTLLEDRLVAKGTVLTFVTHFFADYLATDPVETLMDLLRKARLEGRLPDLFPPSKRTWADFNDHFSAAGLAPLVDYTTRKLHDMHAAELRELVRDATSGEEEPPATPAALVALAKGRATEWGLAETDVAKSVFLGLVDGVLSGGAGSKNTSQIGFGVLTRVKAFSKALAPLCPSARVEAALLGTVQVTCYEDSRLLKSFAALVKVMYDGDVIGEDTVRWWYAKGSNPKGRNVFLREVEPFIKWLDEAESEEEDE